jgi:hypothetical protein
VNALVRDIARTYVQLYVKTGWRTFVEAGSPPEQIESVRTTVQRLQPAAAQALLASFRTEMAAAVEAALADELSRLSEE